MPTEWCRPELAQTRGAAAPLATQVANVKASSGNNAAILDTSHGWPEEAGNGPKRIQVHEVELIRVA